MRGENPVAMVLHTIMAISDLTCIAIHTPVVLYTSTNCRGHKTEMAKLIPEK